MPFDPADIVCVIFLCVLQTAQVSDYSEKNSRAKGPACNIMQCHEKAAVCLLYIMLSVHCVATCDTVD